MYAIFWTTPERSGWERTGHPQKSVVSRTLRNCRLSKRALAVLVYRQAGARRILEGVDSGAQVGAWHGHLHRRPDRGKVRPAAKGNRWGLDQVAVDRHQIARFLNLHDLYVELPGGSARLPR